jgi:hypothetical protein
MFLYRPKPRIFHYSPRFYREDKDPEKRIRFERKTRYDPHRVGLSRFTFLLFLIVIVLLIWYILPRLSTLGPESTNIGTENVIQLDHSEDVE